MGILVPKTKRRKRERKKGRKRKKIMEALLKFCSFKKKRKISLICDIIHNIEISPFSM
jgi:hypothetical protein